MTKVLTTGLNGLVGSKLASSFADQYEFDNLDISHSERPVDITNLEAVTTVFAANPAEVVVHFAAYTDVTGAWKQTGDTNGLAYRVNVVGTQNVVAAAEATQKHVIHISTSYVFDGEKSEPYLEDDTPKPIEWYGQTKALAETAVTNSSAPWTILRIDQPFRSDPFSRPDVVRRIVEKLQANTLPPQFADHFIGPTYIDDFVKVIDWVIRTRATGIFHASSGEMWSDYDLALTIKDTLHLPGTVSRGSLSEYLKTSNRPYQRNTSLNCQKLSSQLDFELTPVATAIGQVQL